MDEGILLEYLYYELRENKDSYGFDRTYRASLETVREMVTARIPTDASGRFDVSAQQRIAARFAEVRQLQNKLADALSTLTMLQVEWPYLEDVPT